MDKWNRNVIVIALYVLIFFFSQVLVQAKEEAPSIVKLRILETTDLHANMMDYDYYQDKSTVEYGLARTSILIKEARAEVKNSLLFDNGDFLQGNPLADYIATIKGLKRNEVHPVIKIMNLLHYDAGTFGNHEFNYGLDFFYFAISKAKFPFVNANLYKVDHNSNELDDRNMFLPYKILNKTVKDENGKRTKLKVGVIGFVTPETMIWEKKHIGGIIKAKDIVSTAEAFVPKMKKDGADIIIALTHSGFEASALPYRMEGNVVLPLSKIEGIDAILFGHRHAVFPSKHVFFKGVKGVNLKNGRINGVAAVCAGYWGNNLGVIDLTIKKEKGQWKVIDSHSEARPIAKSTTIAGKTVISPLVHKIDQKIVNIIKKVHDETIRFVRSTIGKANE
ncbi:metallophosphoesterase [Bacillus sp. 03113]|uniref:metallophosphoesterase n=1 Tax=Bacillus sp. 03113 TaxID=2578211 RepID=UPI00114434EC|nr:metallophosphoesterase [Bacillus sp. 03113]